jgi:hypothetical protein
VTTSSDDFSARSIVYTETFQASREALGIEIRRFDEVMEGVELVLAQHPSLCACESKAEPGIWGIKTNAYPGVPALVAFFWFNDDEIVMKKVVLAED